MLLKQDRPAHRHTPKEKKWTSRVFLIPSAWRDVELRDENVAGYLAASAQLDIHNFPELQSPEDGPGQPDADQRRDEARPASSRWDQTSVERCDPRTRPAPVTR